VPFKSLRRDTPPEQAMQAASGSTAKGRIIGQVSLLEKIGRSPDNSQKRFGLEKVYLGRYPVGPTS
jgi:hypothetical protein